MNTFKLYLLESTRFFISPREQFAKIIFSTGYVSVFLRTFIPILIGYILSAISFKKMALLYVFAGGSLYRLFFQIILPDSLLGILYSFLYTILYLSLGTGILVGIGKISSGKSDPSFALELSARFSFLFILLGLLRYLNFEGTFGAILYTIYFIYFSYILILIFFYGIKAEKRVSIASGLILGLLAYGIFIFTGKSEMDNFIGPTQPEILTPEEEREKIQEAEDIIRKLEEARKEKGYKD